MSDVIEDPAHSAASVIAIDNDDMPTEMVSQETMDKTRATQAAAFKVYTQELQ